MSQVSSMDAKKPMDPSTEEGEWLDLSKDGGVLKKVGPFTADINTVKRSLVEEVDQM